MKDDDLTARRLENLEGAVRAMRDEMAELRAELRAERAPPTERPLTVTPEMLADPARRARERSEPTTEHASAASRERAAMPRREPVKRGPDRRISSLNAKDLEGLVGRYGTLALGALTILMAVGAFLGWAITNDLLRITPAMRVALGFVAAGAIAAVGWRMREKASKRFGHTLLALALAVVHVDAWGAGPYLGLVPQVVALGIAALASAALAALALREDEESLFAVGFGGALVAPFVTSTGRGDVIALLTYGLVVIGLGLVVLRGRRWEVGARIAGIAASLYAFAGVAGDRAGASTAVHLAPTAFALACAWLAAGVAGARHRAGLARVFLALAVLVFLATNEWDVGDAWWVGLAIGGTATVYASLRLPRERDEWSPVETLLLPLAFLLAMLSKLDHPGSTDGALLAALWSGAAALMIRADAERRRAEHLTAALLASALAIAIGLRDRETTCLVLLAAHGALSSVLLRRMRAPLLLLPALGVLVPAALWAWAELRDRPAFAYTPFLGPASLAAFAVSAAWVAFSWHAARTAWPGLRPEIMAQPALARAAGLVVAFLWVREELARVGSPDQATFTLIFYYALTGVIAISVGRLRSFAELRRWGLALALYAAAKAVLQASGLASIGFKVGSYVVVGGFLLAVAYWYRASGEPAPAEPSSSPPPSPSEAAAG